MFKKSSNYIIKVKKYIAYVVYFLGIGMGVCVCVPQDTENPLAGHDRQAVKRLSLRATNNRKRA